MVHLRIVVPRHQAQNALDLLDASASVSSLIHLEGAAKRPKGDLILCDVVREDVSVIVSDLRELQVDVQGSIAIEEIDSEVSAAASKAERTAHGLSGDAVVWEEVETQTSESTELSVSFLAFMSLACMLAAVAILIDSPILIVGAMVVGPEFGPIATQRASSARCSRSRSRFRSGSPRRSCSRSRSAPPAWCRRSTRPPTIRCCVSSPTPTRSR
jgi:hypothetical protein